MLNIAYKDNTWKIPKYSSFLKQQTFEQISQVILELSPSHFNRRLGMFLPWVLIHSKGIKLKPLIIWNNSLKRIPISCKRSLRKTILVLWVWPRNQTTIQPMEGSNETLNQKNVKTYCLNIKTMLICFFDVGVIVHSTKPDSKSSLLSSSVKNTIEHYLSKRSDLWQKCIRSLIVIHS